MNKIIEEIQEIKDLLKLNKPVWTLEDFCLFAGISVAQGYKLTSSGRIKFYRPFGKKIYIDRQDAIDILKQNLVNNKEQIERLSINKLQHLKK